jgi:hypothetical protein
MEVVGELDRVVRKIEKELLGILPAGREPAYRRLNAGLDAARHREMSLATHQPAGGEAKA